MNLADKQIAITGTDYRIETSAVVDCGFLLTLTSYVSDEKKNTAEVFVSVGEAEAIIKILQETIEFAIIQNGGNPHE